MTSVAAQDSAIGGDGHAAGEEQMQGGAGQNTAGRSTLRTKPDHEPRRVIGFTEIKEKYLPHRYPMIMLDRITDYRIGEYVEAIKCVTGNSPELVGHFPKRAIMHATQVVQGFAQLAIIFFKLSMGPITDDEMTLITSVKFRFLAPIYPGDT